MTLRATSSGEPRQSEFEIVFGNMSAKDTMKRTPNRIMKHRRQSSDYFFHGRSAPWYYFVFKVAIHGWVRSTRLSNAWL